MNDKNVQSIDRIFDIIEFLASAPGGYSLNSISVAINLPKSTVHRLLATLTNRSYVMQDETTKNYKLTLRLYEISSHAFQTPDLLTICRPFLSELSESTNEAVHLVVRENNEVVYIYKADSSNSIVRMSSHVGLHNPMYCTGVGKAMLAYMPLEEVRAIWNSSEIVKYTANTIIDYERLLSELELIHLTGYAFDNEEHELGINCLAIPLFNYLNIPVAAISISVPATRFKQLDREKIIQNLLRIKENISHLLGAVTLS